MNIKNNTTTTSTNTVSNSLIQKLSIFVFAIVLTFAFNNEMKACWEYTATSYLDTTDCCVVVTVWRNSYNPLCHNKHVIITRIINGVETELHREIIEDRTLIYKVCAEDGEDIDVRVYGNWSGNLSLVRGGDDIKYSAEEIDTCKKNLPRNCEDMIEDCTECEEMTKTEPNGGWVEETFTETSADGLTITTYSYKIRFCCDEFQFKDAVIKKTFLGPLEPEKPFICCMFGGCQNCNVVGPGWGYLVLNPKWILAGTTNTVSFTPINALMKQELKTIAEKIFLNEMFYKTPEGDRESIFNCNNPPEMRGGKLITYSEASCISYFTALYRNKIRGFDFVLKILDCGSTSCCRQAISFCYDFENDKPVPEIEYTETGDEPCEPNPVPPIPLDWMENPKPIWWFQSNCESGCGEEG